METFSDAPQLNFLSSKALLGQPKRTSPASSVSSDIIEDAPIEDSFVVVSEAADVEPAIDLASSAGSDTIEEAFHVPEAAPPALTFNNVLRSLRATRLSTPGRLGVEAHARELIASHDPEELRLFHIVDLGMISNLHAAWMKALPMVMPYYAVKCNPDRGLLAGLAALGTGFDCASGNELQAVLSLGVPSSRIIFANCCKFIHDLRLAAAHDIPATYDSVGELEKIAHYTPQLRLVLRIRSDDPSAQCALGNKYGAEMEEVPALLTAARDLGLTVFGISFHVGSGAKDPLAYNMAISKARQAFDYAKQLGFNMTLLDIGGGMSCTTDGQGSVEFNGFPEVVASAVQRLFPAEEGVKVIAEPGRYFAEHMGAMAAQIICTRRRCIPDANPPREYWVADGLYGSFNGVMYDHAKVASTALVSPHLPPMDPVRMHKTHESVVWGPTCDGLDCVERGVELPELRLGDWLIYHSFGAYTIAGATDFNGIPVSRPLISYVY